MSSCTPTCQILYYPHPNLRLKAEPVTQFDSDTQQIVDFLLEAMYKYDGVGLAATQINIQKRIVVVDISDEQNKPYIFINPVIIEKKGEQTGPEGCISFPGVYATITRAAFIHVKALDRHGKEFELDATELLSVCIQHERDHLDGKLFIDYLSPLKQQMLLRKMKKFQKIRM